MKLTYQLTFAIAAIAAATVVWANQDGKKCEGTCEGTTTVATSTDASGECCKGKCEGTATVATSTDASGECSKGKCEGTTTVATSTDASGECSKGKCEGTTTVATSTDASGECCKGKCEGTATVATSTDANCEDCAGKCDGKCEDCEGCPIAAAMEKLPKMTFAVGDEKTCCPESAKKLAQDSGKECQFVVAGKTYGDKAEAMAVLVEETETFVTAFSKPTTCQVSGTTTVAGKAHSCSVAAGQTAALADEAMKKVQLTYLVGDQECHCPVEAKQTAEKTGKQTLFVVGKEKTPCNVTARLNLARAKYMAAVTAIVNANVSEKPATDKS